MLGTNVLILSYTQFTMYSTVCVVTSLPYIVSATLICLLVFIVIVRKLFIMNSLEDIKMLV